MHQMRIIFLGSPGAGKGTQARLIAEKFKLPQIATGDMLRQAITAGTQLGASVKKVMDSGKLVPDELMIEIVKERISQPDCQDGFILDGFPRTLPQAQALIDHGIQINYVIEVTVDDEEIIQRMSGRLTHPASGRVYHKQFNPPRNPGIDDHTGEDLIQREDDKEETVRKRLAIYHEQTKPLLEFYQKRSKEVPGLQFTQVSGIGTVDEVNQRILAHLKPVGVSSSP